jgi:sugar lactone lactonase YvrE
MGNQPGNQPADLSFCCSASRTAEALIKDQVTRMLFRKNIVSTRTLLQLAVALAFFVGGVGAAIAANSGIAPLLVPYTINTIAGNPLYPTGTTSLLAGYFGEGVPATPTATKAGATLDAPYSMAVDSAGNVYISDTGNYIIREVNAQSGLITTIAGVVPRSCSGVVCSLRTNGCADGVPAAGNPIGTGVRGITVDAYGNVYFVDGASSTVSVIYRGGTQVAAFVTLEDPGGVAKSGGSVQPGYVYHVAGTQDLGSCAATVGNTDNVLAFQNATLHSPTMINLDSAGNIYIADIGNLTVRVINTQATPQTFFQYTVQPGYMRSITNCSALLTTPCPTATTTSTANTGINGPVNAIVFNTQYKAGEVDAYGNIYQLNGTGSGTGPPGIYSATAYAGGAPLTNLIIAEAPLLNGSYGPGPGNAPAILNSNGLPTYGNSYDTIGNPAGTGPLPGSYPDVLAATPGSLDIRPSSLLPDIFGTFWFMDNHYPEFSRIDQYSGLATNIVGSASQRVTASVAGITGVPGVSYLSPATFTNQWFCVYGSSAHPWTAGPQTYDPEGDGCPATLGRISGNYNSTSDGLGNIFLSDGGEQLMRELPLGNQFPPTPVATAPVTQAIQVHFGGNNPPVIGAQISDGPTMTGNLSTSFSIAPGIADFTINTTTPEFPMGMLITSSVSGYGLNNSSANFGMIAGLPTCTQLGASPTGTTVTDWDCLVYVTFNPIAPGVRQSQLVVTTANGSKYNFALSGVGVGGKLAIDGGTPTPVPATGLGTTSAVAVAQTGAVYIADSANNQIVVMPAGGGTQTAIGPALNFPACPSVPIAGVQCGISPATLSGPMGVAVDASNNVYISDTGNNRVVEVNQITGVATLLGNYVWVPGPQSSTAPGSAVTPTTAPPQYKFKAPQGLAVDAFNNVYVADTGNAAVVEIPSNIALGGAVPLLAYPGAPKFVNPVAIGIDSQNNIYVADTKNATSQIVELPPGGGDLVTVPNSQFPNVRGSSLKQPNGVAVDAAGNVYVSDSVTNQVVEFPSGSGAHAAPFAMNFPGLNSPAGLALDVNGNLYVADSGNKQILFDNRQNPTVNFGTVPQFQTNVATVPLTVTNIGTQPVTLAAPFINVTSTNPSGNTAYTVTNNSCTNGSLAGPIPGGVTCTLSASFNPTSDGGQGENVSVNGGPQSISLTANGEQPLANVVLTAAYSVGTTPTTGATATITATVTQPHIAGDTPAGSVVFSYTIQGDGTTGSQTVNLAGSGGTATASFALPTLLQGRRYTINATYNSSETFDTSSTATPLVLYVPGVAVTVTATSVSYTYGQAVPAITGTVTGITDPSVTYKFTSAATASTPVGTYPVIVVFSGGTYLSYGFPPAVTSTGAPAVVTENPAPLSYKIPSFTAQYGAQAISYGANAVIAGAVNGDTFSATFTPPDSSILNVGTYSVVPTVTGADIGDYTVTAPSSNLTVTPAPSTIGVAAPQTAVLNTAAGVLSAAMTINVSTLVTPQGKGIPTGTVTVTDNFTPITLAAPGTGTAAAPTTTVVPLVAGFGTYTPTNTNPGTHLYSFSYSGDSNFQCSVVGQAAVGACATGGTTATKLLVDNPDFTVSSTTGVINIIPGITPSGNGLPPAANQSTAAPETAIINISGVLGFAGNVAISCQTQNPSYVSCSMTPPLVTLAASGSGATTASILSVSTPATLPLGFFSEVRTSTSKTVLAFLPFGVLAFCMRRRRRLSKMLWMLIAIAAVGAGMQGCGGNQVDFYTPVPTGPQTVTITATFTGGNGIPAETRSFMVPININ